jgi:hypothetical protein
LALQGSHIIQKQTVELTVNGQVDGLDLQRQTDDLVNKQLMPQLEQLMDRYAPHEWIKIDKLGVEVDDLQWDDFGSNFSASILAQIEKELSRIVRAKSIDPPVIDEIKQEGKAENQEQFVRLLLFVLQHGYLPWWSTVKTEAQCRETFQQNLDLGWVLSKEQLKSLKSILKQQFILDRLNSFLSDDNKKYWQLIYLITKADHPLIAELQYFFEIANKVYQPAIITPVLKRILMQYAVAFDDLSDVIKSFSTYLISAKHHFIPALIESRSIAEFIKPPENKSLQITWKAMYELALPDSKNKHVLEKKQEGGDQHKKGSSLDQNMEQKLKNADILTEMMAKLKFSINIETIDIQNNIAFTSENDLIYISNAGLVILAPFLSTFFKKLELVEDGKITNPAKAITLLNYLSTGSFKFDEFEMVLNKVLCGEALETFIEPVKITDEEKLEADNLLAAVLEHWTVLKSTSPDGLRGNFLQREGRLVFEDEHWNLKVQEQSFDMLLAHLPWGISVVKLPWMPHILHVEWI